MTQKSCECNPKINALEARLESAVNRIEKLEADRDALSAVIDNQRKSIETLGELLDMHTEALNLVTDNITSVYNILQLLSERVAYSDHDSAHEIGEELTKQV